MPLGTDWLNPRKYYGQKYGWEKRNRDFYFIMRQSFAAYVK